MNTSVCGLFEKKSLVIVFLKYIEIELISADC